MERGKWRGKREENRGRRMGGSVSRSYCVPVGDYCIFFIFLQNGDEALH